ncbi:MAG: ion transporter [Ginsengibacter sp.]|jgi:voltage-gated potassium channel
MANQNKKTRINSKHDWKDVLYIIIFRANTPAGKRFDISLLIAIFCSVVVILLDSVPSFHFRYGNTLHFLEWVFTILFTIEYLLRIIIIERKFKYIFSTLGIIDLLSILPAYLSIIYTSYQFFMVLRSLRLLRIFKILNIHSFLHAGNFISKALYNSYRKILIFMMFIVLLVIIIGSVMYIVEKDTPGFESIPNSIYWAVVTITTVGYGDISPATSLGKFFSVIVMICGYSIIAVPTGIVTSEMYRFRDEEDIKESKEACPRCGHKGQRNNARYCYTCGERLHQDLS